jgi:mannose-6-phosphate isomerase
MDLLENPIQHYAWGSHTTLAALQGRSIPSPLPEAELWLGAHPLAPSLAVRGADRVPLTEIVAAGPDAALGVAVATAHGGRLPFLLKVLAAERPLSLQAHPSLAQAREGFAREEAAGVPLLAPNRNYKDANHKPELLCALTPFRALCGFRPPAQTAALFDAIDAPALRALLPALRGDGLRGLLAQVMRLERGAGADLVEQVVRACGERPIPGYEGECEWAAALGRQYPGDLGVVAALMLNLVELVPGEALALDAGQLHAYLGGVGIELMATSDNVLRGGLTAKHVDVPELLRVLSFEAGAPEVVTATGGPEGVYPTGTSEFSLSRIDLAGSLRLERFSADLVLCLSGSVELAVDAKNEGGGVPSLGPASLTLGRGQSAFICYAEGPLCLFGQGVLFRATAGRPPSAPGRRPRC